jgi:hypothetical protein
MRGILVCLFADKTAGFFNDFSLLFRRAMTYGGGAQQRARGCACGGARRQSSSSSSSASASDFSISVPSSRRRGR